MTRSHTQKDRSGRGGPTELGQWLAGWLTDGRTDGLPDHSAATADSRNSPLHSSNGKPIDHFLAYAAYNCIVLQLEDRERKTNTACQRHRLVANDV